MKFIQIIEDVETYFVNKKIEFIKLNDDEYIVKHKNYEFNITFNETIINITHTFEGIEDLNYSLSIILYPNNYNFSTLILDTLQSYIIPTSIFKVLNDKFKDIYEKIESLNNRICNLEQ